MTNPLLIDLPAELHSARLRLRPPRAGDGAMLCQAITASLPELRRFLASLPWVAAEPSVAASETWCRQAQANVIARTDLPFLLLDKADGALRGVVGLHRPDWATPKAEIGYWGHSGHAGQGWVSEGVAAVAALAFHTLGLVRLELVTDEANAASRRLALRCGFALQGVLRHERRAPDGTLRNTCVYARHPGLLSGAPE